MIDNKCNSITLLAAKVNGSAHWHIHLLEMKVVSIIGFEDVGR